MLHSKVLASLAQPRGGRWSGKGAVGAACPAQPCRRGPVPGAAGNGLLGMTDSSSLRQRQDGQMQRFIREVNTTNRACVLWDLAEDADYIIQVQSIGLYGESQASKRVHFRTLKETDRLPSNSSNQGEAAPSSSPTCHWWDQRWRSPQHTGRGPAASEEGAALGSRLLGTHRVITGSRVVQAAVVSTMAMIMSPSPGL